ncbi:MAG: hypothetical protein WD358_08650 [Nitriliruptoraceae bacterium]
MAFWSPPGSLPPDELVPDAGTRRSDRAPMVRRVRGLPSLRAVVGALLVVAAALIVHFAYTDATAEPDTHFLVAAGPIAGGTVVTDHAHARSIFGAVAMSLPQVVAERAIEAASIDDLVGTIVVAPLDHGDLVVRTMVVDDVAEVAGHIVAITLSPGDALGGQVLAGHRVDVLATYGSGRDAYTAYVVRDALVTDVGHASGTLSSGDLTVTLALDAVGDVQAVGHAARAAAAFLARGGSEATDAIPRPYRPMPPRIDATESGVETAPPSIWDDAWDDDNVPGGPGDGGVPADASEWQAPPWWPAP